ncbi:hypothetical protein [Culturomica massiliensis]|uniref:hypothetical protein n=1 Tax=Culturomica massiliensis TaxID=1841857 RepID=UPI000839258C|nr:hypothetical protein [Culturomica massiliensis]
MEKKISKIKDFVKSLELNQVITPLDFELFSGGCAAGTESDFGVSDKNKHNERCCNGSAGDDVVKEGRGLF